MENTGLLSLLSINSGIVMLLLIILVIILSVITVSMSIRLSRMMSRYRIFMRGKDGQSMEKVVLQNLKRIDKLERDNETHHFDIETLKKQYGKTLNKYGMVKYDAFDDVGGKLSFALAMLDSENTGFILDAIHSRDNCFFYIKEIVKGESYVMLSNEEIEALKLAVESLDDNVM